VQVSLSAEAQADADAAVDWDIGAGVAMAAGDFVDELGQALELLNRFPELGKAIARNVRTLPLHSFPYSLIYRLELDAIRVVAASKS